MASIYLFLIILSPTIVYADPNEDSRLAQELFLIEEYDRALRPAERYARHLRKVAPESSDYGDSLMNIQLIHRMMKNLEGEENFARAARDVYLKDPLRNEQEIAKSNVAIARALISRGSTRFEAIPFLEEALRILRKRPGENAEFRQWVIKNMGSLYGEAGEFDRAVPLLKESLEGAKSASFGGFGNFELGFSAVRLAALYCERYLWEECNYYASIATKELQRTIQFLGDVPEPFSTVLPRREWPGAEADLHVVSAWELQNERPELRATMLHSAFISSQLMNFNANDAASRMATKRLEANDPMIASLVRERQEMISQYRMFQGILEDMQNFPVGASERESEDDLRAGLTEMSARIEEIYNEVTRIRPQFEITSSVVTVTVKDIQRSLSPDQSLVYFHQIDEAMFVWLISKTSANWRKLDVSVTELASHIISLRCGLDISMWEDAEEWPTVTQFQINRKREQQRIRATCMDRYGNERILQIVRPWEGNWETLPFNLNIAHDVYEAIFGNLPELSSSHELLVAPAGPLVALPLQVLVTKRPKEAVPATPYGYADVAWLADKYSISIIQSLSRFLLEDKNDDRNDKVGSYLGFANPLVYGPKGNDNSSQSIEQCSSVDAVQKATYTCAGRYTTRDYQEANGRANVERLKTLCPLPDTAAEVCNISRDRAVAEVYLGRRASESRIKAMSASGALARFDVVHFATHGFTGANTRDFSSGIGEPALLMSPPAEADTIDDGILTASEIASLRFDAQTAVLSACNTGIGSGNKDSFGEIASLSRAFLFAGARSVIVSHWPVYSDATFHLISKTLSEAAKDRKRRSSDAIRAAMLAIKSSGTQYSHPTFWAPFVSIGD